MKRINILLILLFTICLTGCGSVETNENYDKIVEVSSSPAYGRVDEMYEIHYLVRNNNTIEIYGSYEEFGIKIDYIEGIIIEITEEEKENIIKSMKNYNLTN